MRELDERLKALREAAKQGRDPTAADETLFLILETAERLGAKRVLEIGAAEGLTCCALLTRTAAEAVAVERDPERAARAREHFKLFGVQNRVTLHEGDAGEILPLLDGEFDLIFLDGPKVQYIKYLPDCKRLLRSGGVLFSDDVLREAPKKRKMLAEHIREYLRALESDPDFSTEVLPYGEGLAVSVKR